VLILSKKENKKEYTKLPVAVEPWEEEDIKHLNSRRASVAIALRVLTESLDDVVFQSWARWEKLYEKYNLDPNKDYYILQGQIFARRRPGDPSP